MTFVIDSIQCTTEPVIILHNLSTDRSCQIPNEAVTEQWLIWVTSANTCQRSTDTRLNVYRQLYCCTRCSFNRYETYVTAYKVLEATVNLQKTYWQEEVFIPGGFSSSNL